LVKQDLPFMNPCWLGMIPWLSFPCAMSTLRMNHSLRRISWPCIVWVGAVLLLY